MNRFPTTLLLAASFFLSNNLLAQQAAANEHFGKPLAFWLERLRSKDLLERDEAIQVIARIGPAGQDAVPLLKPFLKDENLTTRLQVALTLWTIQGDGNDAVPTLIEDFARLSPVQKQRLVEYVTKVKKVDASLFAMFEVMIKDPQYVNLLTFHLPQLVPDAVPFYLDWIEKRKGSERADMIYTIPSTYLYLTRGEILTKYLKDPEPIVQVSAAAVLLLIPARRDDALAVLLAQADNADKAVAELALWALANHRPVVRKADATLQRGLKHPNLNYRLAVGAPVVLLHPEKADEVVPILEEGLKHTDPNTRYGTYTVIESLNTKSEKLKLMLMARLRDPAAFRETTLIVHALTPFSDAVGQEIGELIFAEPTKASRFFGPSLRGFAPQLSTIVKTHLMGTDALRQKLAVDLLRWFPPSEGAKLLPTMVPLLTNETLIADVLQAMAAFGKESRPAAPAIFALLDGANGNKWLPQVQRTLQMIVPEPSAIESFVTKLKRKPQLTEAERILGAELALLHPDRRQDANSFLEPILNVKTPISLFALSSTLDALGPEAAPLVPYLRTQLKLNPGHIFILERCLIRIGSAAKEVVPDLLEQVRLDVNYPNAIHRARLIYALAPEQRKSADERINQLFLERLQKFPYGDELNYEFAQLTQLCQTGPGPTEALLPLLRKIVRDYPRDELRADLASVIVKLDKSMEPELVKLFEDRLGQFPTLSTEAMIGLLRLRPDHPRAIREFQRYLDVQTFDQFGFAMHVALRCELPLPGVRELFEAKLLGSTNHDFKFSAYVTLMRYNGKLNPEWIEEILSPTVNRDRWDLRSLRYLGPVGKPLIPRLRAMTGEYPTRERFREIADLLERAQ